MHTIKHTPKESQPTKDSTLSTPQTQGIQFRATQPTKTVPSRPPVFQLKAPKIEDAQYPLPQSGDNRIANIVRSQLEKNSISPQPKIGGIQLRAAIPTVTEPSRPPAFQLKASTTGIAENSVIQEKGDKTNAPKISPAIEQPNQTGLPDRLKAGIENLSGYPMDDVRVHYNSDKPAQLQAHAYTQGTDIYVASGQEKHLPHEAWHVVQQKQGRVKPTMQMKEGVPVNDNEGLEHEADVMGANGLQMRRPDRVPTGAAAKAATAEQGEREQTEAPEVFSSAIRASGDKVRLDFLSTQRAAKQNPSMRVIQRLTANKPPPHHDENPIVSTVHEITETKTNEAGAESDTGNFTHKNNSQYLDPQPVYYKKEKIGEIRTKGADNNTLVKMHLVNSYLNPNANIWSENWVWGSATLNHRHNEMEEIAKKEHPTKNPANVSLNYESQADSGSRPSINIRTGDDLAQIIYKVKNLLDGLPNINIPSLDDFKKELKIMNQDVDTFVSQWSTGVGASATTKITVRYRVSTAGDWESVRVEKLDSPKSKPL